MSDNDDLIENDDHPETENPDQGHYETIEVDDPNGVRTHRLHAFMGYGVWTILEIIGGIILVGLGAYAFGWVGGLTMFAGFLLSGFVSWFPTHGAARGRTGNFRTCCLLLSFLFALGTGLALAVMGQKVMEDQGRATLHRNNLERAKTIEQAYNRGKGQNNRTARQKGSEVAGILKPDADAERAQVEAETINWEWLRKLRPWMRLFEIIKSVLGFLIMAGLLIYFREAEDLDGDGSPDFLQAKKKIKKRIWKPSIKLPQPIGQPLSAAYRQRGKA